VVPLDHDDAPYRPELPEELRHLGLLHPRRKVPHEDLPRLPEIGGGIGIRAFVAAAIFRDASGFIYGRRRRRRRWRGEFAREPELVGEGV